MVFESLGCENREMMMATEDKHSDDTDDANRLRDDSNDGECTESTAALFGVSVFHSRGAAQDDGLGSKDMQEEFGDEGPEEISAELYERVEGAKKAGLSEKWSNKLKTIIQKHIFILNQDCEVENLQEIP